MSSTPPQCVFCRAEHYPLIECDGYDLTREILRLRERIKSLLEQLAAKSNRGDIKMKTLDEMIAVMQAAKDGKTIQRQSHCLCCNPPLALDWIDTPDPDWNWVMFDFRIKPEPRRFQLFRPRSVHGWWKVERIDVEVSHNHEVIEVEEVLK